MSTNGAVRPPIHALLYGDPGSKKSTCAATFPKPMNVFFFDPIGKDGPYLRQGSPTELYTVDGENFLTRDVVDNAGELLIRLQYFGDIDPKHPTGYKAFLRRMQDFYNEDYWATAVLDSVTFMELGARMNEKYVLNPKTKEPRQWWAGATDSIEEILQGSFGAAPINIVTICHIDEHKNEFNGEILRRPKAPGRLAKGLSAGYGEIYHAYVAHDDQGQRVYLLQTAPDSQWIAESQLNAPDPSWPDYDSLWT